MEERKTTQAKLQLVRYIRDRKLAPGAKLPSQDFFRRQFRFGTATITAAIRELKDDGVLEVRDKVGVFVIDPNADGHAGRVIGLTAYSRDISAYYGSLLCFLQMELVKYGCRAEIFCCDRPGRRSEFKVTDFPGLRRWIERGELAGVISLDTFAGEAYDYFREKDIPALLVGSLSTVANAVFIDDISVLRRALARMAESGARRTALVLPQGLQIFAHEQIQALCDEFGIPADRVFSGLAADGAAIARKFLRQSAAERPDAWIALDDVMAGALASALALQLPAAELPAAAVLCNRNTGFSFPVPRLYRYEIQLELLAAMGVRLLLDRITKVTAESRQLWYEPREYKVFTE